MVHQQQRDWGVNPYSNLDRPFQIADWRKSGERYIQVYPTADADKQITLYGYIQINPRVYMNDEKTDNIPLSREYDSLILEYAKSKMFYRLKDYAMSSASLAMFESLLSDMIRNMQITKRIMVDYK
jgi:hypothetical protein